MKALAFLIVACLLILTAHVAFQAGQQEQRRFEALCETPGVQCVVRFDPEYLVTHRVVDLPSYVGGEFADLRAGAR